MTLRDYRRKRHFGTTSEPARGGRRGAGIFVVQLHHASHRHFDFRLELDGVLKSWAIPKGPSFDPKVKRLAVEVEDHPLAYATFEGDIAAGNYGAGRVDIFDHGTWEPLGDARAGLQDGELKFELHGAILRGSWVLVRTRLRGAKQQWLLIKHADRYAAARDVDAYVDPVSDRPLPAKRAAKKRVQARAAPAATLSASVKRLGTPETLRNVAFKPQLCTVRATPPDGDGWLHEVKWDGYRIVATVVAGHARLWSRNGIEWTAKVPELAAAIAALDVTSAQFDGEMVVLRDGRDDFNALQGRLSAENREPAVYMLFDLPHCNGRSLRHVPLLERKALLHELLRDNPAPALRFSEHVIGNGAEVFAKAVAAGLEGIVSKRVDSGYSGTRNGDWIKIKGRPSDEFVVVGFTEPKGSRTGIGALLLARVHGGGLQYAGRVGTGFDQAQLAALRERLEKSVVATPPADIALLARKDRALAIWVRPTLIVEVAYQGIGSQGPAASGITEGPAAGQDAEGPDCRCAPRGPACSKGHAAQVSAVQACTRRLKAALQNALRETPLPISLPRAAAQRGPTTLI